MNRPDHCCPISKARLVLTLASAIAAVVAVTLWAPIGAIQGTAAAYPSPPSSARAGLSFSLSDPSPRDFRFVTTVHGYYFKPGEHVEVSVEGNRVTRVAVTAGSDGGFTTPAIAYTWVFCGPRGATQPPPTFVAAGSQGTVARFVPAQWPCPILASHPAATAQLEAPSGPQLEAFRVEGFGFAPGETVAIHEPSAAMHPAGKTVRAAADRRGAFVAQLEAYAPPPCTNWGTAPVLEAVGKEGTSVVAPLGGVSMMGCPPPVGPGPATGTATPGSPGTGSPSAATLSLRVARPSIRPGAIERVIVQGDAPGTITLRIRYAHHGGRSLSAIASPAERHVFHWRIPPHAHKGIARITITLAPGGVSLSGILRVRRPG